MSDRRTLITRWRELSFLNLIIAMGQDCQGPLKAPGLCKTTPYEERRIMGGARPREVAGGHPA